MRRPPDRPDEQARLADLGRYEILDTDAEPAFDGLVRLAAHIAGTPIALISLVDASRQWFKARHGLEARETPADISFCGHAVSADDTLLVEDAKQDPRFHDNPLVTGDPDIRFYLGIPLRSSGGHALGTLCVIDRTPRNLSSEQQDLLAMLAAQANSQLELRLQSRLLAAEHGKLEAANRALRGQQAQTDAVFEALAEGVVVHDRDGRVTACNDAAEGLLGQTLAEMQGLAGPFAIQNAWRPSGGAYPVEEQPVAIALRTALPARGAHVRVGRPAGGELWLEVNAQPLLRQGSVVAGDAAVEGVVTSLRDITDERQLAALREHTARQERLAMAGTLAAGVGHEINNPLTYVGANLELALEEVRDIGGGSPSGRVTALAALLVDAQDGAERIRKIVKGLQGFAREDNPVGPTDLARTVEVAVNLATHELRPRARMHISVDDAPAVLADESRLSQVLVNLLINAAQSFERPDPEANRVFARAFASGDSVVVEITDNGPGIPEEHLQRVFDPFFTTKEVGVGTGLGLSISQAIIRGFGGELSVTSRVGEGTTFRMDLPAAPPHEEDASKRPSGQHARVLVVDDEQGAIRMIARALTGTCEVTGTEDPREAALRLERGEEFAVVLCDVTMPHLTGPALHAKVASSRPDMARRFVFITGGVSDEHTRRQLDAVPNRRILKPFKVEMLRELVRGMIDEVTPQCAANGTP